MKKDLLKTIKYGLLMWVIALTVICAGFYIFIKARQATDPTLSDTNPSALYVNVWETLTAAKRNTLVNKTSWLGDWQTASANTTYQADKNLLVIWSCRCTYNGVVEIKWYTDSNSSPTTLISQAGSSAVSSLDTAYGWSFVMPVKKWDYWKVTRINTASYASSTNCGVTIYTIWI